MAWQDDVNNAVLGGNGGDHGEAFWYMKRCLLAAGWTVVQSGDGISFQAGDIFSGTPSGIFPQAHNVGDWSNADAWMILGMPGSLGFELCFWRAANPSSWLNQGFFQIKVSPTGFTDNTNRSATRPPDAADQEFLIGSAPTTRAGFLNNAAVTNYVHTVADDAASGQGSLVYRYWWATKNPAGTMDGAIYIEALVDGPVADPQPWVLFLRGATDSFEYDELSAIVTCPQSYRDYGGGSELWTDTPAMYYFSIADGLFSPRNMPMGIDGIKRGLPIPYGYVSNSVWRGIGNMLHWNPSSGHNYPDVDDPSGDTLLYWQDLLLPWPAGTVPL